MALVIDASIAASWMFEDEGDPRAGLVLARLRTEEAIVPSLFWFEIRNILIVSERRKRIAEADTAGILQDLAALRIRVDHEPSDDAVMRLARKHRLSVYDAAYLELALRTRVSLATLDAALMQAAASESIEVI